MSAKNSKEKPNKKAPGKPAATNNWYPYGMVAGILILTFWCYHYSLHNQFLNWDDGLYVFGNKYIRSFSADNLKMMLFHSITPSNYHPLTMVSLAVNYHFSQANPPMYYLTNISIHCVNVILVFLLATALCKRIAFYSPNVAKHLLFIAGFCTLWFAVHPMHVESVSWISERKDVLYSFFYLSGLLTYLKYLDGIGVTMPNGTNMNRTSSILNPSFSPVVWYIITFLLFFLSCLSKPMAVSFPLLLFTIDFLLKRKFDKKIVTEKILFFACSLFFGIIAYRIQKESGAVADFKSIPFTDRILFTFYGFNMYLIRLLLPIHLNAFCPYPDFRAGVALPLLFYIMPVSTLLLWAAPFYFKWKKQENLYRITLFGLTFYFFNVIFILQFVSCGDAIIADRYTYTAYFGPVFALMYLASELISAIPRLTYWVIGILTAISLVFAVLCEERTKVWHNPETFWTDVIAKSDMHSQLPYLNLGDYYISHGAYEKAYPEYVLLPKIGMNDAGIYRNLAMIYGMRKQFDSCLYWFGRALQYDSTDASIYSNRAITYANLGKYELALKDFSKAYSLDTTKDLILSERAQMRSQVGRYADAAADYTILIRREPNEPSYYMDRGNALLNGGNAQASVQDYLHFLQLQPNNGTAMYNLSQAYNLLSDYKDALRYATKATQNNIQVPAEYMSKLQKEAR